MSKPGGRVSILAVPLAITLATCLFLTTGCGKPESNNHADSMTLERKVGQLLLVGFEGTSMTPELENLLNTVHPGGVILFGRNVTGADQLKSLVRSLQATSLEDSGQPLFVAIDQEGGQVRRLAWLDDALAQADITGSEQAYELALRRAEALSQLGINLNLAPVLDLAGPGDFLYKYGRILPGDAQNVGVLGLNLIRGQKDGGIFSAAKHFPGYGGINYDPETTIIPVMPGLPETSQFQTALQARPEFVMTANVIYQSVDPNLPFSLSPAGIGFLRGNLAGDYLIITDDLASKALKDTYTLPAAAVLASQAGADILLISSNQSGEVVAAYDRLLEAARSAELSQSTIDDAVSRIVSLKGRLAQPQLPDAARKGE